MLCERDRFVDVPLGGVDVCFARLALLGSCCVAWERTNSNEDRLREWWYLLEIS